MKKMIWCLLVLVSLVYASCSKKRGDKPRVLVFSKTAGYTHASIPNGIAAISKLAAANNFMVDTTKNAEMFNEDSLQQYAAVIFLSTTGDVLDYRQQVAFERYVQSGGGYVGIHAAADTEYDWEWYGRLAGGYFRDHPGINDTFPNVQQGSFTVTDANNDATRHLPKPWTRTDEFYSYKTLNPDNKVLLTLDENSYNGGYKMGTHPIAWYKDFDGGRAFYTGLGHTEESYTDDNYLKHLLAGIQYAIGENQAGDLAKATSQYPPEENRFTKTVLAEGDLFEPTEMTILPNLDVLILQRRGEIMLYKNETKTFKQAGFLDVYYKTSTPGVNAEEGMLGLAKDPNYEKNSWVYIYYSPVDTAVNRLSRFTFKNDTIDKATEKVILDVRSQREICCHTGGSIAFDKDGLLYLSTGDNSTPFNEKGQQYVNNGYGPLNDIPGHEQYDAARSSGNTNDLRGKILRIKVNEDATYSIPDGNLFAKGTDKARPEIYVMGNRNPYRISVDQKTGYLYWGEVGPDAKSDSFETRGPRGYDEVNQARKAGFFGWPFFVGKNYAYRQFDYATGQSGPAFDAGKPINVSRNNTGLKELPAVSAPFIWYPYDASPEFPQVGTGGRNAMAGPVYYTDMYPKETRLPDYYNGKFIMYEWIRGWIKAVTFKDNGDFDKMEPFLTNVKVNALIDMEVGPDGRLYFLEYGKGWFSKNPDAGLYRVDYNGGNRPPQVSGIAVNRTSGTLPFTVKATVQAKDLENDKVTYTWNMGDGTKKETTVPEIDYTYNKAGDFRIVVDAKDDEGAVATSNAVNVYAGNQAPEVQVNITGGNKSFFLPGKPVKYAVTVRDQGDTSTIDMANLLVSVDYVEGFDKAGASMGHQQGQATIAGKTIMQSLDCKGCHKEAEKSIGPSYLQVSEKYKGQNATNYLVDKIIKGGAGVWGEVSMPAHPTLPQMDAKQIVSWIMTLANKTAQPKSLPANGNIVADPGAKTSATMVLSASYTDKGGNNTKPLTGNGIATLRSNTIAFKGTEKAEGFTAFNFNGANLMVIPKDGGWFALDSIDLTDVRVINIAAGWQDAPKTSVDFEVRLDSQNGKLLGKGAVPTPAKDQKGGIARIPIEAVNDGKFHNIYIVYKPNNGGAPITGGVASVQFSAR